MAIVAKSIKETKKFQHLRRIYENNIGKVVPKKKAKKINKSSTHLLKESSKKLTKKEIVYDVCIILLVSALAFIGYIVARFVNF